MAIEGGERQRTDYRPDIDGLRAIAVLVVVLYHFRVPGFSGGYVGVDIFFVISGYLITSILQREVEENRLSLVSFYERRARRIVPALAAVVIASTATAYFMLLPRALSLYGQSVASVALMVPNIFFWQATKSYFSPVADTQPLLHMWSLGVEEQFYLLFPLYLWLVMRLGHGRAVKVTAVFLLLSFGLAVWAAPRMPNATFFLPFTRAWELLAGVILSLSRERLRHIRFSAGAAAALGLVLIGGAATSLGSWAGFSGLTLLVPVSGAALLIAAGCANPNTAVSRLLAARPLVFVGLISYSLYLWHWPIYVFLRHSVVLQPLSSGWTSGAITLSFILATASWYCVEQPFRRRSLVPGRKRMLQLSGAAALALSATGSAFYMWKGLPSRTDWKIDLVQPPSKGERKFPCRTYEYLRNAACRPPAGTASNVLLWGDSFAGHYASGFDRLRGRLNFGIARHTLNGCSPVLDFNPPGTPACKPHNDRGLALVDKGAFQFVILSSRWENHENRYSLQQLTRTVRRLRSGGAQVLVIGQTPIFHFYAPDEYLYHLSRRGAPTNEGRASLAFDPALNRKLEAAVSAGGGLFFDPLPLFCRGQSCLYRAGGKYLIHYESHLSPQGSEMIVQKLLASSKALPKEQPEQQVLAPPTSSNRPVFSFIASYDAECQGSTRCGNSCI